MKYLAHLLRQTGRSLWQTWPTQLVAVLTVGLSVLVFSLFFLVYLNLDRAGAMLTDELRVVVYFESEPGAEIKAKLDEEIRLFSPVDKIVHVSREEAFARLEKQLGPEKDILLDLDPSFLPPSIEVYPRTDLAGLAKIKDLADFLVSLPGAIKVQTGSQWWERFSSFSKLVRIVMLLSALLLVLTIVSMVSSTIKLAIYRRREELETLSLLGATRGYIRGPFLLEGLLQGTVGSTLGLGTLYFLFRWLLADLDGTSLLGLLSFSFFPPLMCAGLVGAGMLLCAGGSLLSMHRFLRV